MAETKQQRRPLITLDSINTVQGRAFFTERTEKFFAACTQCQGTCEVQVRDELLEQGWRSRGKVITEPMMMRVGCPACWNYAHRMERFCNRFFMTVPTRYQGCILSQLQPSAKSVVPLEKQQRIIDDIRAHPDQSMAFFGPPGTGKTTLMTAMYGQMVWRQTGLYLTTCTVYRFTSKALLDQFTEYAMRGHDEENPAEPPRLSRERIEKLARQDIKMHLFLEEVDKVKQTDSRIANLFEVVDALYNDKGQLVLNSNLTPAEFQNQFGTEFARRITDDMCKIINLF